MPETTVTTSGQSITETGIITETEMIERLRALELDTVTRYTLADAIREGSLITSQANGWGTGERACALSAARLAARARGYLA